MLYASFTIATNYSNFRDEFFSMRTIFIYQHFKGDEPFANRQLFFRQVYNGGNFEIQCEDVDADVYFSQLARDYSCDNKVHLWHATPLHDIAFRLSQIESLGLKLAYEICLVSGGYFSAEFLGEVSRLRERDGFLVTCIENRVGINTDAFRSDLCILAGND
jgi:hypothetical protein